MTKRYCRSARARADRARHLRRRSVREEVEHREGAAQQEPGCAEGRELRGSEVADDRRVDQPDQRRRQIGERHRHGNRQHGAVIDHEIA